MKITFDIIMAIYWIVIFPMLFIGMRRNDKVARFKVRLLDQVSLCCKVDIKNGRPFTWRYDSLRQGNYNHMTYKFWRKLDSFYPDKSFLDPNATGPARRPKPKRDRARDLARWSI